MPIYEYQCNACAHQMEKLQRMSEDRLVDCPECGQPALKRLVSAAAFRLKGSGWYETDFKQDNKRNLADNSSKDKTDKKSSSGNGKEADTTASGSSAKKDTKSPSQSAGKSAAKSASKESSHA